MGKWERCFKWLVFLTRVNSVLHQQYYQLKDCKFTKDLIKKKLKMHPKVSHFYPFIDGNAIWMCYVIYFKDKKVQHSISSSVQYDNFFVCSYSLKKSEGKG